MNTEQIRKDFEEWMGDGGLSPRAIERNSKGDYILMQAASAWEVWKAAHTHYAKPAAPVVLPPHPDTARLQHAAWRLEDILKNDDPQAWKEARKFLERLKKEQEMEGQQQADALDAERYRWLRDYWLGNEPEAVNMERARGQRGLDAAIDAAIAKATGAASSDAQAAQGGEV